MSNFAKPKTETSGDSLWDSTWGIIIISLVVIAIVVIIALILYYVFQKSDDVCQINPGRTSSYRSDLSSSGPVAGYTNQNFYF